MVILGGRAQSEKVSKVMEAGSALDIYFGHGNPEKGENRVLP